METDEPHIEWVPPSGVAPGGWYSATDCTETGNLWPPPTLVTNGVVIPSAWSYSALPTPHETFPGIVSTHAARLRTTMPLQGVWGADMGITLGWSSAPTFQVVPAAASDAGVGADRSGAVTTACPGVLAPEVAVDLSAYSGVTFWAKGDPAGARTIMVQLFDVHTDPKGGNCNYTDPNSPDACYNGFATRIALTDTFAQYTIDFASLQQDPGWGYRPNPDVLDTQHVFQLVFEINTPFCGQGEMCVGGSAPPVSFDFWIDDLYFVNK